MLYNILYKICNRILFLNPHFLFSGNEKEEKKREEIKNEESKNVKEKEKEKG